MKKVFSIYAFFFFTFSLLFSEQLMAQSSDLTYLFNNYHRYFADGQKVKDIEKERVLERLRQTYAKTIGMRNQDFNTIPLWEESQRLIDNKGRFIDLITLEDDHRSSNRVQGSYSFLSDAFARIWKIAEAYRKGQVSEEKVITDEYLSSIIHYGKIELGRDDGARFHASCFFIPTAAINIYFTFLNQMDAVENGTNECALFIEACDVLKALALQSWTQPLRKDSTDLNVVQLERFRNHVWWVGGNALGYRSLLPTAVMYKSIPMIDLLAEIGQRSISTVSQNTYNTAFWNEGFTTDGAGWGHGKQTLVWGYSIDGIASSLILLEKLIDTPWEQVLTKDNKDALLNFFRGSNWYYYKGYVLPCLDRYSAVFMSKPNMIRYAKMLKKLIDVWGNDLFSKEELNELNMLYQEALTMEINMNNTSQGIYQGSRWFFNNDDLIKKSSDYHVMINMSSSRCDGLESAIGFADEYNFCSTDGQTLFQRRGNEYRQIIGAWDVLALPGVTARKGMENLTPVTNWRGYSSKHNFSGGATRGGENSVAGYLFEKKNNQNENDKRNEIIYGVKSYKSYFWFGDYFVALGAGITNLQPELDGDIHTTIEQTVKLNKVTILKGEKEALITDSVHSFLDNGESVWVKQEGGFAYTVLPEFTKNASFVYEQKANEWVKRNGTNKGIEVDLLPKTAHILRLWVDHGKQPIDETYGYVVYCGDESVYDKEFPFDVLKNDTSIQAIKSSDEKIIEAVFYEPKFLKVSSDISLEVSAPAVVLLEDEGKEYLLTINDPCMNASLKNIVVTLNGNSVTVELPQGEYAGRPVTVSVKK